MTADRQAAYSNPTVDRWWVVDCACRSDGPWTIYGPAFADAYCCARCGAAIGKWPFELHEKYIDGVR